MTCQLSLLYPIDDFWRKRRVKQRKPKPRQRRPRELLRRWMPQHEQDSLFSFENFDLKLDYPRQAQTYRHGTIAYGIRTTATADTFDPFTNYQNKNIIDIFGSFYECCLVPLLDRHGLCSELCTSQNQILVLWRHRHPGKHESFVGHER